MTGKTERMKPGKQGLVLVVDDEPKNRELLRDLLEVNGHAVIEAADGIAALEAASAEPCDVILLDVMMPRLDGYESCRQLKRNPLTAPIPVLMVTALAEKEQRLLGIDAGANDYLTKPIEPRDVLLRVRNALQAKRLYDQVQEDLKKLRELETLRDNLVHMIVHDLRSPLAGMVGLLELFSGDDHAGLAPEERDDLLTVVQAGHSLLEMVSSLLDVSRLEAGQMPVNKTLVTVRELAAEALRGLAGYEAANRVRHDLSAAPEHMTCDRELTRRIIANLLGNALKFTRPPGEVCLIVQPADAGGIRVLVRDTGYGIPPEHHQRIFEKFGQVEAKMAGQSRHSTGLGLTFCKLAVEAQGGVIGVQSEVGKGSTFWFTLPQAPA